MAKVPDLIPITDFRQDAARALKHVQRSAEPVIITQRGRAAAVMLSVEVFEQGERERQILRLLARATRTSGRGHRFYERATKVLRRLEEFPESERVVPEFPDLPFREVIIRPYRFFYRIGARTVWVVGVWHGAQLPAEPLDPGGA